MAEVHIARIGSRPAKFGLCLVMTVLAVVPAVSRADDERPSYVTCKMEFGNGKVGEWNFVNRRLSFKTRTGNLSFWLHELDNMAVSIVGRKCTVHTVREDTWETTLNDDKFEYYYLDSTRDVSLFEASIRKLVFLSETQAVWTPKGCGKILFEDGNVTLIDLADLTFDINNRMGNWKLPAGAVEVMQFHSAGRSEPVDILAQFPSGRTERFRSTHRRQSFRAMDTFGNKLDVRYRDVQEIIGRLSARGDTQEQAPSVLQRSAEAQTVEVTSKEGRTQGTTIPAAVWTIKGALGAVLLPSAILREITSDPDDPKECAVTVYCEYFFGKIAPRSLSIPIPGRKGEHARLDVGEQRKIGFDSPELVAPRGYLSFRLRDGDRFYGCFSEGIIEFEMNDETESIPARSIIAVDNPDFDDKSLVIATSDGRSRTAEPDSARVEVTLLINGARCRLRWDDIESVGEKNWKLDGPAQSVNPIRLTEPAMAPEELDVDTSLGTLTLPYSLIHEVHNAPKASVSCFATVYGDMFVGKRISEAQIEKLSDRAYSTRGQDDAPRAAILNRAKREAPSNCLAWRLTSGDMFHARFRKDRIKVLLDARDQKTKTIDAANITAIVPIPGKGFEFISRGGVITGRPKSGEMLLTLPSLEGTVSLPVKLLEQARRGSPKDLPPPVTVIPGVTSLQEGMVPIGGGWYMMGRERGGKGMPDETPRHKVLVSAFYMDACEITRDQFTGFIDDTGYETEAEKRKAVKTWRTPGFKQEGDEPVVFVSRFDAVQYCNWRSKQAELEPCYEIGARDRRVICDRQKNGYRLPTEAEWEYAARNAGEDIEFPWLTEAEQGSDTKSAADTAGSARHANFAQAETEPNDNWLWTNPVKTFAPNKLGLYGMGGNVWEWCEDVYLERAYHSFHRQEPRDPCVEVHDPSGSKRRVMRGGSFANELDMLRCVSRGSGAAHAVANRVGFRCVRRVEGDM